MGFFASVLHCFLRKKCQSKVLTAQKNLLLECLGELWCVYSGRVLFNVWCIMWQSMVNYVVYIVAECSVVCGV